MSNFSAHQFAANEAKFLRWPTSAHLMPGGRAPRAGQIIIQAELADTLRRMVEARDYESGAGGFESRKGAVLAVWRILRCSPLTQGGPDPVPAPRGPATPAEYDGVSRGEA